MDGADSDAVDSVRLVATNTSPVLHSSWGARNKHGAHARHGAHWLALIMFVNNKESVFRPIGRVGWSPVLGYVLKHVPRHVFKYVPEHVL